MVYIIVIVTVSSAKAAEKIANELVSSKLAACVNIIPGIRSIFMWNGKKESVKECLLMVKTKKSHFKKLKDKVKRLHSYDIPEIIGITISEGSQDYLDWIGATVK